MNCQFIEKGKDVFMVWYTISLKPKTMEYLQ